MGVITMIAVAAGIVTYCPEIERLQENLDAVINQVQLLYIVDNASSNITQLRELCQKECYYGKIRIVENCENQGIATALNQICDNAYTDGFSWVLTLDQDSVVPENMIKTYEAHIIQESETKKVAMYVPVIWDRTMQEIDVTEVAKAGTTEVETAITSGTLMRTDVWKKVGGFTEKLFIDYVDFDYCMKVRLKGYCIVRVNEVRLLHELGNATQIPLFAWLAKKFENKQPWGRRFREMQYTTNHSPTRLYYVTRNQYYYMKEYADLLDTRRIKKGMYIIWGTKIVFEKHKWKKILAIYRGSRDGKRL